MNIIKKLNSNNYTNIPTLWIENLKIKEFKQPISIPLATYEKPLWLSVGRGAEVSNQTEGIEVFIKEDKMTRSVIVEADDINEILQITQEIENNKQELQKITAATSNFAQLIEINTQIVANLLFIRFAFLTNNAAGHNMTTKAANEILNYLLNKYKTLKYVSISGNYCTDKKVSAVNGILGRGKYCIGKIVVPKTICKEYLHCLPEELVQLNIKKNLIGSILAGSLRSANAHFANMILAIFLATGQDAANIIEGSQGITFAEVKNKELHFSVTLPNLIVGTVGNGKDLRQITQNLQKLSCEPNTKDSAQKLAKIITATVLCGELSLLAAQCNKDELINSHLKIERNKK